MHCDKLCTEGLSGLFAIPYSLHGTTRFHPITLQNETHSLPRLKGDIQSETNEIDDETKDDNAKKDNSEEKTKEQEGVETDEAEISILEKDNIHVNTKNMKYQKYMRWKNS